MQQYGPHQMQPQGPHQMQPYQQQQPPMLTVEQKLQGRHEVINAIKKHLDDLETGLKPFFPADEAQASIKAQIKKVKDEVDKFDAGSFFDFLILRFFRFYGHHGARSA